MSLESLFYFGKNSLMVHKYYDKISLYFVQGGCVEMKKEKQSAIKDKNISEKIRRGFTYAITIANLSGIIAVTPLISGVALTTSIVSSFSTIL